MNSRPEAAVDPARVPHVHYDTNLPVVSPWRRFQIPWIAGAVYGVIRTLGSTLRYEVLGSRRVESIHAARGQCIWAFWHRTIIPTAWWFRRRGIVIMNTTHFDGQWMRRVVERLGYGTAQGSSTRGGLRGLVTMAKRLEEGLDVAFTIDGPRGPRFVAKKGPMMLARRTGRPVFVFHIGVEHGRTVQRTWDHLLLPRPFSRAVLAIAPPLCVPQDADREMLEQKHAEMQKELERVRDITESWFSLTEEERARYRAEFGA